jgi:aryl-alcohol dehydrogenase-like predicted oxidoreductase
MHYTRLGHSDLKVSSICLGSMTWGLQNTQQDADEQIDYALSKGVNFIDTAEMYAIPPSPQTYGQTESIIGHWLAKNPKRRSEIVLASKIAGNGLPWIQGGGDIGATSLKQLKENIQAFDECLNDEALSDISAVMHQFPMPF